MVLPDGTVHEGDGDCKFLEWEGDIAVCTVHGQTFELGGETYAWEETPCGRHGQVEREDSPCRIGAYLRPHSSVGRARS